MEKLGAGGFGAVFMVADRYGPPGQIAAMKVERRAPESPPLLQMEVDLMERLAGKQHVLPVLGKGRNKQFNWLVMGYAGPDLSKLRRRLSSRTFSPCTTLMIGLQIFNALQGLHDLGFVHRDVKPENLAVDRDLRRLCLLDFGMARRFINDAGRHHRARPRVAFRGTARYASPWALQDEEQSRRDDLYSTVYVMVEMIKGKLPWDDHQSEISRPDLGRFKQGLGTDALCQECEPEIKIIAKMIDRLR